MGFTVRGTDRTIVARNWLLELLNPFAQQLLTTFFGTVVTIWQAGQAADESFAARVSPKCLTGSGRASCARLFSVIGLSSLYGTKRRESSRPSNYLFDRGGDSILPAPQDQSKCIDLRAVSSAVRSNLLPELCPLSISAETQKRWQ